MEPDYKKYREKIYIEIITAKNQPNGVQNAGSLKFIKQQV